VCKVGFRDRPYPRQALPAAEERQKEAEQQRLKGNEMLLWRMGI